MDRMYSTRVQQPPGGRSQISFGSYEPTNRPSAIGYGSSTNKAPSRYDSGSGTLSTLVSQPPGGRSSVQLGFSSQANVQQQYPSYQHQQQHSLSSTSVSQPPGGRSSIQLGSSGPDYRFQVGAPRVGYNGEEGSCFTSTQVSQPPGGRSSIQFGCDVPQRPVQMQQHGMSSYGRNAIYDNGSGSRTPRREESLFAPRPEQQFREPTSIPAPSSFRSNREETSGGHAGASPHFSKTFDRFAPQGFSNTSSSFAAYQHPPPSLYRSSDFGNGPEQGDGEPRFGFSYY